MFTGIIEAMGTVAAVTPHGGDMELLIDAGNLAALADTRVGDSIAVAGVCLTATRLDGSQFAADVSNETLTTTTLGRLVAGNRVNLEQALRAGAPLGGHYVTGHVDGLARLVELRDEGRSTRLLFELPVALARYVAAKGSVTVDGVSLTVNDVDGARFGVNIIPHTRTVTTLGTLRADDAVNVEIDIIARYVERMLALPDFIRRASPKDPRGPAD
jgi:riboflavin synthase